MARRVDLAPITCRNGSLIIHSIMQILNRSLESEAAVNRENREKRQKAAVPFRICKSLGRFLCYESKGKSHGVSNLVVFRSLCYITVIGGKIGQYYPNMSNKA